MRFLHNPFEKDVDLNTILYRITYPEYFLDSEFADEEEPEADEVIFGRERDLEAKLTWSYGVDCWRAIYVELDEAKQQVEKSGKATSEATQRVSELQEKLDLCLRVKGDLEAAAEDERQGKPVEFLVLAEKSLPTGSKIYFRKVSVSSWSEHTHNIPIPEWAPAPPSTTPATIASPSNRAENYSGSVDASGQRFANGPHPVHQSRLSTSHKNLQVTLYIIAHALSGLIDELVADNRILSLSEAACLRDDDTLDQGALLPYLSSKVKLPPSSPSNGENRDAVHDTISEEDTMFTLSVVTLALALFADEARKNHWIEFSDAPGEGGVASEDEDRRFTTSSNIYISKRIYEYLHLYRKMRIIEPDANSSTEEMSVITIQGQGKRVFLGRLDEAKSYVGEDAPTPDHSLSLIHTLVSAAHTYDMKVTPKP